MTTDVYKVGGKKTLYTSSFEYRTFTFMIQRHEKGWQISQDGVRLQVLDFPLKPKAIKHFTTELTRLVPDDARLRNLIEECKRENRDQSAR